MSYLCTTCIKEHIMASGPQEMSDLRRECRTQASDYSPENVIKAINDMVAANELIVDSSLGFTTYELPDSN